MIADLIAQLHDPAFREGAAFGLWLGGFIAWTVLTPACLFIVLAFRWADRP